MELRGKVALIAGAGRNNGRAVARRFAAEGADLVLVSRSRHEELDAVAAQCRSLGADVLTVLADVSVPDQVHGVVEASVTHFGRIDVLVSLVGIRPHARIVDTRYDDWLDVFAVNCHSLFLLTQAVAPVMIKNGGGSIIAFGGLAAMRPQEHAAAVVSSKHALYGLVKSIALELGPSGIRANLINPGHISNVRANPEWFDAVGGEPSEKDKADSTPLRRMGSGDDTANAALFLASDRSSFITGDRLLVAGGRYM